MDRKKSAIQRELFSQYLVLETRSQIKAKLSKLSNPQSQQLELSAVKDVLSSCEVSWSVVAYIYFSMSEVLCRLVYFTYVHMSTYILSVILL